MTGREQYQNTARGALRADAAKDKGKKDKPKKDKNRPKRPKPPGRRAEPELQGTRVIDKSAFELYLNRSGGKRTRITEFVEGFEWSDSSDEDSLNSWPSLTGSVSLRQRDDVEFPKFTPNAAIDCFCTVDGKSAFVWRMRIVKPTFSALDGAVTLELQDEIRQLWLPRGTFRFSADKKHKQGWTPREIATKVCGDYKIPHGSFMDMRINGNGKVVRIPKLDAKRTSPGEVIQKAYEEGRKRSAHRYVVRWNHETDRFEIKPMKESDALYEFTDEQISDAQIETRLRSDFCTALRVTWWKPKPKAKKGAKSKKKWKPKREDLDFFIYKDGKKVTSGRGRKKKFRKTKVLLPKDGQAVIQKYGYIERRISFSAKDKKEARDKANNILAKAIRPVKSLTFTAPGEFAIRRGDFIDVTLPEQGFDGKQQMWVQSVTHSVGERYTMEVTARFDDPWSPARIRKEQAAAERYRKRAQKKDKAALSKGRGADGKGIGGWIRVGATVDNFSGGTPACNSFRNNGFSYAELGVAGANKGMARNGGFIADALGVKGQPGFGLSCGYKIEVRNLPSRKTPNPKTYVIVKADNGSGQAGDARYKVDLEPGITNALNFPGKGFIEIRRAG